MIVDAIPDPQKHVAHFHTTRGWGLACEIISRFVKHFGRPRVQARMHPETGAIEAVEVQRGSPCGSTYHAARTILGMSAKEAVPKVGLICVQYPCLTSMQKEPIDKGLETR